MPDTQAIYARLTTVFQDVFDDDTLVPRPSMTAKDVEEWDSVTNIQLMLSVEKAFGIRLSAGHIGSLANVGDLVKVIETLAK